MPLKFHFARQGAAMKAKHRRSLPIAMLLATAYLYYVVEYKPSQKKVRIQEAGRSLRCCLFGWQEVGMKVVHQPSDCQLKASGLVASGLKMAAGFLRV